MFLLISKVRNTLSIEKLWTFWKTTKYQEAISILVTSHKSEMFWES